MDILVKVEDFAYRNVISNCERLEVEVTRVCEEPVTVSSVLVGVLPTRKIAAGIGCAPGIYPIPVEGRTCTLGVYNRAHKLLVTAIHNLTAKLVVEGYGEVEVADTES